jgi:predicted transcriptional regulator
MDKVKLFEGELKLMELLWEHEGTTAKELSVLAAGKIGWNKNTTYTVIKKLIAKGAIRREEPAFICRSLIGREDVGREEAKTVLRSYFGGSVKAMLSSFMAEGTLQEDEAEELRSIIEAYGKKE